MAEQFNLASAVVEFKTNFADVAKDISDIAKYSKRTFEEMEKQTEQVDNAMQGLQDSMQDVADSSQDMSGNFISSFSDMISITGALGASISGVMGIFRTFGAIVKRVAGMSFRMLQFGIQSAITAFQALISVVTQLMQRITQAFMYLATLPFAIVRSVREAHRSLTDMLDDLTKKFVFLQLDIRHIMQLMQRFLMVTAGAMGGVTAAAANFEEQFVVIRRVTDMTARSYYDLERQLRSTASEIGRSATELAELASVGGRLGIEGVENLETFAEVMGKLGVATVLEGEKAATEFARLMTIMDVAEEEMEQMASTIVQLGNSFAAFEDEILGMSLQLAGAGDAIGLATDELMGLATAMAAVDIRVERGGSAMSRTMIEIANAVQEGGDALDTFADLAGTTAEEFAHMFYDEPIQAIFTFLEGLAEMEELPFRTLEELNLAQIRTRDTILRLLGAQEQLGRSLETSNQAWREGTALQEEYNVSMDTTRAQLRLLRENVLELGRRLGDLYNTHIRDVIEGLTEMVSVLIELDTETFEAIAGFLALISVLVGVSAALLVAVRGFFTIMTALTLLARGIVWALTWGAALYFAGTAFRGFTDILGEDMTVLDVATAFLEGLRDAAVDLRDRIVESQVGQIVANMFEDIGKAYEDFVGWLTDDQGDLTEEEWMQEFLLNFIDMMDEMVNSVSYAIDDIIKVMEENDLSDAIDVFVEDVDEENRTVADAFIGLFESAFRLAFQDIPRLFGNLVTEILMPALWDQLTKEDGVFAWATGIMEDWTEVINEATKDLNIEDEIAGFEIPETLRNMMSAMLDLGVAVGRYFWEGVSQAFEASGFGDHILDALRTAQDFVRDIDWETDDPITSIIPEGDSFASQFVRELLTLTGLIAQSLASALYHQVAWFKIGEEIASGIWSYFTTGQTQTDELTDEQISSFNETMQELIDKAPSWMQGTLERMLLAPDSENGVSGGGGGGANGASREERIFGEPVDDSLKQLLAIVKAEAGGEPLVGQAGVVATVLNRVIDDRFPDTIEDVITEEGQFEPVSRGIWQDYLEKPIDDFSKQIKALKHVLDFGDPTGGSLFFYNPELSDKEGASWFDELIGDPATITQKIGDHVFVSYADAIQHELETILQQILKPLENVSDSVMPQEGFIGLSSGGILKGYGGGDQIPALLERGEAVIPKEAVKQGTPGVVSWLKGMGVPGYQDGLLGDLEDEQNMIVGTLDNLMTELDDFEFPEQLSMLENIYNIFSETQEEFDGLEAMLYGAGESIIYGLETLGEIIIGLFGTAFGLEEDTQDRFLDGIYNITDWLRELLHMFDERVPEEDEEEEARRIPSDLVEGFGIEPGEWERPLTLIEGLAIGFSSVFSSFENELEDGIEMFSTLRQGISNTVEQLTETQKFQRFTDWLSESDSMFARFTNTILETGSTIREGFGSLIERIMPSFEENLGAFDEGFGAVFASFDPMVGAIMEIAQSSEVFGLIMESANEIINAFVDMIGMLLEPLYPLIQIIEMTLVPIFNALGTILSAIFMPILRMLFPVLKTFGIILVTVAQVIGTVWNTLLDIVSIIPGINLDSYKIDLDELSDARQDLIDASWDELLAKEELAEEAREVSKSLRNVPAGFAVAFRRFQSAAGQSPIPRFAEGGIAKSATLGIFGEAGTEAIMPLDRLENMLANKNRGGNTTVIFEGDVYGLKDFERKVQSAMSKTNRDNKSKKYGVSTKRGRR